MKKPRLEELLMSSLFVPKRDIDPSDWQTHVRRNIVLEVRKETCRFYGNSSCLESQYPGLDYSNPAHRLRLSHFTWHRKLFRAFDHLGFTENEIQRLCKWEGTRHAREAYEANNRMKIRDTTWEGVTDCRYKTTTATRTSLRGAYDEYRPKTFLGTNETQTVDEGMVDSEEPERDCEEESEDEVQESVGAELHQRLLAATEARARGEDVTIDADWEQWLKEATERGTCPEVPRVSTPTLARAEAPRTPVYWGQEIPEYLSDNPTPEIAAIQALLPPPPQYFPQQHPEVVHTISPSEPPAPRHGTSL